MIPADSQVRYGTTEKHDFTASVRLNDNYLTSLIEPRAHFSAQGRFETYISLRRNSTTKAPPEQSRLTDTNNCSKAMAVVKQRGADKRFGPVG